MAGGWDLVRRGLLTEVSLLPDGVAPSFPRAAVVWIGEPKDSSAAGRPTSERSVASEVIIHDEPVRIRRECIGQVLGVR